MALRILPEITRTTPLFSTALIRWMVGAVFLSEGIQKWLYPAVRGSGRFQEIGLPMPEFLAYSAGAAEILCGLLLLAGLWVRVAVIPLLAIMMGAVISTKLPILVDQGLWEAAHASRTDFCMMVGSLFILLTGAGKWSIDVRHEEVKVFRDKPETREQTNK